MQAKLAPDQIWQGDRLGRRKDAEHVIRFVRERLKERATAGLSSSYVLNVDAGWGKGKTFFLQGLCEHLRFDGHLVTMVDAWRDDHADDPLLSVIAAIDETLRPHLSPESPLRKLWEGIKADGGGIAKRFAVGVGVAWLKNKVGTTLVDVLPSEDAVSAIVGGTESATDHAVEQLFDAEGKAAVSDFQKGQRLIATFRQSVSQLLTDLENAGQASPLFVLIDELDRCRPPFAISMLERVKHLFDLNNVVFIVATDSDELSHSISAVYGEQFDASGYLRRFFDRRYAFPEPSVHQLVEDLLEKEPINAHKYRIPHEVPAADLMTLSYELFALSIRDVRQVHDWVRTVTTMWDQPFPMDLPLMLPIVVAAHLGIRLGAPNDWAAQLTAAAQQRRKLRAWPSTRLKFHNSDGKLQQHDPLFEVYVLTRMTSERRLNDIYNEVSEDGGHHFFVEGISNESGSRNVRSMSSSIINAYPQIAASAGRFNAS